MKSQSKQSFQPIEFQETPQGSVKAISHTTISFNQEINEESVDEFIEVLSAMNNAARKMAVDYPRYEPKIDLLFSTPGGSVYDGFRMSNMIEHNLIPIHIHGTGLVASSGVIVMLSGAERSAYPHTAFLYHPLRGGLTGTFTEMKGYYTHIEEINEYVTKLMVENTNMTEEQLKGIAQEEHWFDADTALEYGIIDSITYKSLI